MHRIDTSTAQKDKFGAGKNGFTLGNAQTGVPPTEVSADILDALQEEICSVIEMAGMALDKSKNNQLSTAIDALFDAICPIGYPIPWIASSPPNERFFMAQGQSFDKVKYPKLAKLWPSGVVPYDPRGKFLRGWDNGRGVDPGRAMLSNQGDAIRNITAKLHSRPLTSNQSAGAVIDGTGAFGSVSIGAGNPGVSTVTTGQSATSDTITFDASRVVPTAGENRPDNIAVNYIFRAW